MSSIITSILSSTVGLLWNKARDSTAEWLRDGDVTDSKIREVVVRGLNDVKTKLNGISRKDLLSSYNFLQEGVDLLNVSLDKSKDDPQQSLLNEVQTYRTEASGISSGIGNNTLKKALELLSNAMRIVKLNSDKEFESAKKRFEESRKAATNAFCNEALGIKDRILAAKLRIVSEILECLDCPETAITGCLSFLKKLHSIPAIRETFAVYINGGVKSMVNKAERVENVKSVMLINGVLVQYFFQFSSKDYYYLDWPVIELTDRTFHPILHWHEVSTRKSMSNELTQHPKGLILDVIITIPELSAVNSQGQIVTAKSYNEDINIISADGKTKVVKVPDPRKGKVVEPETVGLGVDNDDNVYVVRKVKMYTENASVNSHVLYVLDESWNMKHYCTMDFLEWTSCTSMKIAFNKSNNIVIKNLGDIHVYICDKSGKMERLLKTDSDIDERMTISDKNEFITSTSHGDGFQIHTEDGRFIKTVTLPKGHLVKSLAFHFVARKILVLTLEEITKLRSLYLHCYTRAGELETSTFLSKTRKTEKLLPIMTSHSSGPAAVVWETRIAFI